MASVIFQLGSFQKSLVFQCRNRTADLGLVKISAFADLFGSHLSELAKMKQDPPFCSQHAVFLFVYGLELTTGRFSRQIQLVGEKGLEIKRHRVTLDSYIFN